MARYKICTGISSQHKLERMRHSTPPLHILLANTSQDLLFILVVGEMCFHMGAERTGGERVCVQVSQQLWEEHTCWWKSVVRQDPRPLCTSNCALPPLLLWDSRPWRVSLAGLQAG